MTTAATALPLLALRITAGPVELRGITDDLLGPLADLATDIHDPDFMPFGFPWTLTPAPDMPRSVAQYHWGKRASFSPAQWTADFAVFYESELVGCQGFSTKDYLIVRGGETGSWLGRGFQDDALHDRALAKPVDPVHAVLGVAGLPADAERRRVVREGG